jgi:hypothetical protein
MSEIKECEECGRTDYDPYNSVEIEYPFREPKPGVYYYMSNYFCSFECLFKWTYNRIIPNRIHFPVETPKGVMELESRLTWKEIHEKRKKLLKTIGCNVIE